MDFSTQKSTRRNRIKIDEFYCDVRRRSGLHARDVTMVVNAVFESLKSFMEQGKCVHIQNFGQFHLVRQHAVIRTIPPTGQLIFKPAKFIPKVKFLPQFTQHLATLPCDDGFNTAAKHGT